MSDIKFNRINMGKLYLQLIDFGLDELLEYQDKLENFMIVSRKTVEQDFDKLPEEQSEDEEYHAMLEDSLAEKFQNYERYYPNRLRCALILQTYSYLETQLKKICDEIYFSKNLKFEVSDIKGMGDLDRMKQYLKKTVDVDFEKLNPEWKYINEIRNVRNKIAHENGLLEIDGNKNRKLIKFIRENDFLSVLDSEKDFLENQNKTYAIFILSSELNEEFIKNIKKFFTKLINQMSPL